jgi:hypothetical protein
MDVWWCEREVQDHPFLPLHPSDRSAPVLFVRQRRGSKEAALLLFTRARQEKKKQIGSIQKERKDGPPPRQPDIITTTPAIPLSLCHSYTLPLPTHAQSPRKK